MKGVFFSKCLCVQQYFMLETNDWSSYVLGPIKKKNLLFQVQRNLSVQRPHQHTCPERCFKGIRELTLLY